MNKKTRFEVFKRDAFKCGYCGRVPPNVLLEVDHVVPRKHGGKDDLDNLLTACFDCNRGKSSFLLESIPLTLEERIKILEGKRAQAEMLESLLSEVRLKENIQIAEVSKIFEEISAEYSLSDSFEDITIRKFIQSLPLQDVKRAMAIACSKPDFTVDRALRYFCGICWTMIKRQNV